MSRARPKRQWALPLYVAAILLYLLLPLVIVIPMSFSNTSYLAFPPQGLTWRWYGELLRSDGWMNAIYRSLFVAAMSAVVATILGTLASLALARSKRGWTVFMRWLFLGPQVVPVIILALGVLLLFTRLGLYGSYTGIIIAHSTLALPFVIMATLGVLQQTGESLEKTARVLGASPVQAFWHVTLPCIAPSVFAGFVFAFFVSFDELVISLFVMAQNETLPMRIWADVRQDLSPVVAVVATLLIIVTALVLVPIELLRRRRAQETDLSKAH
ncbi:ABC transporter permease [Bordetella trematum]|uniref:ABC transporter permease n=1 Tax=Bordetella trematum TaxID=123899 RepID=UPI000794181E|nr:ABC transporter permease [Bordetella trematum]AUL45879.1 spermidine/putrescine ABC transpoter (permease) [Bordetella trematum]QIM71259.1 ABC transporter permease [Bordetella trematum]SAI61837.1 ABC transporter permease [Bordetella trematum]